jgi:cytochrome c biogenesis protein CcmG, thiol:disulfide interchange protein DsbE
MDRMLQGGIALCLAALILVVYSALDERIVVAGDRAPGFSVETDGGRTITPKDFGGRLLVLNFWATWCPPCVEEMPSLDSFQRELAQDGVVVLGISVDRAEGPYKQFLQRTRVSFQTVRDPEAGISSKYGTYRYPETYIINAEGKVVQKIIGPTDWMDPAMLNQVRSLLQAG